MRTSQPRSPFLPFLGVRAGGPCEVPLRARSGMPPPRLWPEEVR